jgi:hypothetical protein
MFDSVRRGGRKTYRLLLPPLDGSPRAALNQLPDLEAVDVGDDFIHVAVR